MLKDMNRAEINARYGRDAALALAIRGMGRTAGQDFMHGVAEAADLLLRFREDATVTDGVPRWNTNGSVPPSDILALWESVGLPVDYAKACAARQAEVQASLATYRRNQPAQPTEEELAEARAAFGRGVEVVDIISGRRYTT